MISTREDIEKRFNALERDVEQIRREVKGLSYINILNGTKKTVNVADLVSDIYLIVKPLETVQAADRERALKGLVTVTKWIHRIAAKPKTTAIIVIVLLSLFNFNNLQAVVDLIVKILDAGTP